MANAVDLTFRHLRSRLTCRFDSLIKHFMEFPLSNDNDFSRLHCFLPHSLIILSVFFYLCWPTITVKFWKRDSCEIRLVLLNSLLKNTATNVERQAKNSIGMWKGLDWLVDRWPRNGASPSEKWQLSIHQPMLFLRILTFIVAWFLEYANR